MQLCDKTAYVRGLRYRWVPLLSRNSLLRFLHLMPPCIRPNQSLLSGKPCPSLPAHNATFALKHSGQNACGIPDGETIIMTGGGNSDGCHNFVTRWGISFKYTLLSGKTSKKCKTLCQSDQPNQILLTVSTRILWFICVADLEHNTTSRLLSEASIRCCYSSLLCWWHHPVVGITLNQSHILQVSTTWVS